MKIQFKIGLILVMFLFFPISSWASSGIFIHGAGAVNEALGGAATAGNDQDLLGSLYRNPANASIFKGKLACIDIGAIFPDISVDSSVTALGLKGSSNADNNIIPLCNFGVVFNDSDTPFAGYIALVGEAGLTLKIPQSSTNPIFMAQAGKPDNPFGGLFGGLGSVHTQIEIMRIAFGVSYKLNEKLSLGFSVAPSVSRLKFAPAVFAAPDDADGNGIYTFPTDVDHEFAFGMGFQVGVRYQATENLAFGLTFTSPTWFEGLEWSVSDELGNKRQISFHLDRPMDVHLGVSYIVSDDTLILLDGSWFNYSDTKGFDECCFDIDGSLKGLGWDDMWVIALGVQYDIFESWTLRAGYNYSSNPIDDKLTFFNVSMPLHVEHHMSLGASWKISSDLIVDIGYTHAFRSSQSGPWYDANNMAVPGTEVETSLEYDQLSVGVTFAF